MKRVLICSNIYPPNFVGGAELVAHNQALCLKELGWDVTVFAGDLNRLGRRYAMSFRDYQGLPVYRVKLRPEDYQPEYANFFHKAVEAQFKTVLDQFCPDVVHVHNLIGLSAGILHAAKTRGIRTVATLHDSWGVCYKGTLIKREFEVCEDHLRCAECMAYVPNGGKGFPIQMRQGYLALQLGDVDAFISPSRFLANRYIQTGFPASLMNVVANGLNLTRFSAIRKAEFRGCVRFTFIGHFGTHKGLTTLIDALALIPKREEFFVNLVGNGELLETMRRRVADMGLRSCIKFWGKIDNSRIGDVLSKTDVLILPSICPENQPVSITEAMATRTAVIGSNIGGIPELVADGQSGYLFEAGNPTELAAKMSLFVTHPERIRTFGDEGFRRIVGNTFENQVKRVCDVYCGSSIAPGMPEGSRLILCAGDSVSRDCARAISDLSASSEERARYCFAMSDWLAEDQFAQGTILWVVGAEYPQETIYRAMRCRIPLLVPEADSELRELCRAGGCGLYYRDAAEAREAIRYLIENIPVLQQLGANAAARATSESRGERR
jgi:glycosyltransferase involved in cell wall biosynthesis